MMLCTRKDRRASDRRHHCCSHLKIDSSNNGSELSLLALASHFGSALETFASRNPLEGNIDYS